MKSYCDFVINKNPECQPIPAKGLERALSKIEPDADDKMVCQMAKHELRAAVRGLRLRLSDVTHERDALRREVDELAHIALSVPCNRCNARDFCDNRPSATPCIETLRAWAKQQAAQAGKGDTE